MSVILTLILAHCIFLNDVDQPSTAKAGETITATMHVRIDPAENRSGARLVIGFLAPKAWKAAANTTVTYTSNRGNDDMVPVPASVIAPNSGNLTWSAAIMSKAGLGGNLIPDMEWVVFWSSAAYNIGKDEADIMADVKIVTKVGSQNTLVKLGYFVANSLDGFTAGNNFYNSFFSPCFEVTGGSEPLIDFCNPRLATVDPAKSLDNDIITILFDGDVTPTDLSDADTVLLCATAFTADGQAIAACRQDSATKLIPLGSKKWRIDIWPRGYFNLTATQFLDRIEYYFTDRTGSIKVGYGNTTEAFVHKFICE